MTHTTFERRWILGASAAILALLGWAMVAARCSAERDAALLERARSAATVGERCRAMNTLCLHGYWDARPSAALETFLAGAPPDVREFVRQAHFTLLAERPSTATRRSGC